MRGIRRFLNQPGWLDVALMTFQACSFSRGLKPIACVFPSLEFRQLQARQDEFRLPDIQFDSRLIRLGVVDYQS